MSQEQQDYGGSEGGSNDGFVLWIMFGMFVAAHATFLGIGFSMRPTEATPELGVLPLVLTAVGTVPPFMSAFGTALLARGAPFLTHMILRFALAESAAVFGLVLAFLGADPRLTGVLAALGFLAHLLAAPTDRAREAHARLASAD